MRYMNKEWFLECEETTYELHMGPIGHEGELPFREGTTTSVSGFVYGEHIAPIVVANQGTESRFWNENRTPSWAGQGDRRNAVTDPESGANAPEPRSGLAERGYRNAPPGAGRNRN